MIFPVSRSYVVSGSSIADALQLRLEQLLDRQLAPPIRQADDDAVDALLAHEPHDVGRRADDLRVDDASADHRRVVVDEADNPVRVVVLVEHLARHHPRGAAGADDEHVLLQPAGAANLQEEQPPQHDRDARRTAPTRRARRAR